MPGAATGSAKRSTSRWVMDGSMSESPVAAARTAAIRRDEGASLSRKPAAPARRAR